MGPVVRDEVVLVRMRTRRWSSNRLALHGWRLAGKLEKKQEVAVTMSGDGRRAGLFPAGAASVVSRAQEAFSVVRTRGAAAVGAQTWQQRKAER